ncbi:MAG: sulfurtransferase [Burkholderiaceae bacterium]|nr:MAG: sulfurtransferase [Burkholderiaceae bacterium]
MISEVSPAHLSDWLLAARVHGEPVLLDVREPLELQTASIQPGEFALLTIPMGEIPARLAELDPAQPVACLCHHGARSLRVATFLAQNGFEHVVNITGGIDAWSLERDTAVPRY